MKYLSYTLIAAMLTVTAPAFAHEGEHHESSSHEAVAPKDALASLKGSVSNIDALVAKGDLSTLHEEIEKAEVSIKALQSGGANNPRLEAALKQLSAQLGNLHNAADKNDTEAAKTSAKKVNAALKLVEIQAISHP